MTEKILFICGSLNQTTMLHKIAQHMTEYDCYFTLFYEDGIEDLVGKAGWLNFTVFKPNANLENLRAALPKLKRINDLILSV